MPTTGVCPGLQKLVSLLLILKTCFIIGTEAAFSRKRGNIPMFAFGGTGSSGMAFEFYPAHVVISSESSSSTVLASRIL